MRLSKLRSWCQVAKISSRKWNEERVQELGSKFSWDEVKLSEIDVQPLSLSSPK
jgi:hypothetical protein